MYESENLTIDTPADYEPRAAALLFNRYESVGDYDQGSIFGQSQLFLETEVIGISPHEDATGFMEARNELLDDFVAGVEQKFDEKKEEVVWVFSEFVSDLTDYAFDEVRSRLSARMDTVSFGGVFDGAEGIEPGMLVEAGFDPVAREVHVSAHSIFWALHEAEGSMDETVDRIIDDRILHELRHGVFITGNQHDSSTGQADIVKNGITTRPIGEDESIGMMLSESLNEYSGLRLFGSSWESKEYKPGLLTLLVIDEFERSQRPNDTGPLVNEKGLIAALVGRNKEEDYTRPEGQLDGTQVIVGNSTGEYFGELESLLNDPFADIDIYSLATLINLHAPGDDETYAKLFLEAFTIPENPEVAERLKIDPAEFNVDLAEALQRTMDTYSLA